MEKKNNKISNPVRNKFLSPVRSKTSNGISGANGVNKKNKKLTEKQITELLKSQGQKLGFLIAGSTLPEKVKLELVDLTSKMNLKQLERLLNIFEAKYADERTRDIDEKYKKKLEEAVQKYTSKQEEIDKNFLKQVEVIKNL